MTTTALNTIREALIHAYEESIYVSSWRKYRDAVVSLNHIAGSLASYRSTTETMLGIEIPESEGLLEFVPCLMRAVKDQQTAAPFVFSDDPAVDRRVIERLRTERDKLWQENTRLTKSLEWAIAEKHGAQTDAERHKNTEDKLRAELQSIKNGGGW